MTDFYDVDDFETSDEFVEQVDAHSSEDTCPLWYDYCRCGTELPTAAVEAALESFTTHWPKNELHTYECGCGFQFANEDEQSRHFVVAALFAARDDMTVLAVEMTELETRQRTSRDERERIGRIIADKHQWNPMNGDGSNYTLQRVLSDVDRGSNEEVAKKSFELARTDIDKKRDDEEMARRSVDLSAAREALRKSLEEYEIEPGEEVTVRAGSGDVVYSYKRADKVVPKTKKRK